MDRSTGNGLRTLNLNYRSVYQTEDLSIARHLKASTTHRSFVYRLSALVSDSAAAGHGKREM